MSRIVLLFFLATTITSPTFSQKTGTVDYPYLGIKFTIPSNWKGQETEEAFLIASDTKPGLIVLIPHEAKSIAELEQAAKEGIAEEGTLLNLSSSLEKFGAEGVGGEFSGYMDGTQAKAYIIGVVNPFGYGVSVVAVTDVANYSAEYRKWAEQVASSLQFRRPKEPEKTKEWKDWIRGAKLVYMKSDYSSGASYNGYSTYSSYSSRREILLCPNNQFSYYSSSQSSFDTGGGFGSTSGNNDGRGTWKVSWDANGNSTLELSFSNGDKSSYELEYKDSKTLLNGSRYFVIHDHGECY